MKWALVITGGESPDRSRVFGAGEQYAHVCAADSGLETALRWGIIPDTVVGDMDSISDRRVLSSLPQTRIIEASPHKDETDTELALQEVASIHAGPILLAGGGGGRLDHVFAIKSLFERTLRPSVWLTAHESVCLVKSGDTASFLSSSGSIVSVFPLAAGARSMRSEGLVWSLNPLSWDPGHFGISNRSESGKFSIHAGEGDLLVVIDQFTRWFIQE